MTWNPNSREAKGIIAELIGYSPLQVFELGRRNAKLWKTHTDSNKRLVLAAAELTEKKERCVVIGAGPCYDIPLLELAQMFERVELLDLNPKALAHAISDLPAELVPKVQCRAVEVTHVLPQVLYHAKQELIKSGKRSEHAINKVVNIFRTQHVGMGELAHLQGDLIVSDMILSQLPSALLIVDKWFRERFKKSIMSDTKWIEAVTSLQESIQNAHVDGLFAKKGAVVVLATDFGIASTPEEANFSSLQRQQSMTILPATMQKIAGPKASFDREESWIWHRNDSPPTFSPVLGLVFRPDRLIYSWTVKSFFGWVRRIRGQAVVC